MEVSLNHVDHDDDNDYDFVTYTPIIKLLLLMPFIRRKFLWCKRAMSLFYRVFTRSSKRPAAGSFHLLEVCWIV